MSNNHSLKISKSIAGQSVIIAALILLLIGNARFIINNLNRSKGIDEKIVSEANPRLNRQQLKEAVTLIKSFSNIEELTSIFSSATVEEEAAESGVVTKVILVDIQNASGINGAAADIAARLEQVGYQINTISTAPAIQTVTTITFKAGYAEEAQKIERLLESNNWPIGQKQEASGETEAEITIILGK